MTDEPKTNQELAESMGIVKNGYTFSWTHEYLANNPVYFFDPFRKRTVKSKSWVVPDPEAVTAYREWEARYLEIEREGIDKGFANHGYEGLEFSEPEAHWEYEYEYEDANEQ